MALSSVSDHWAAFVKDQNGYNPGLLCWKGTSQWTRTTGKTIWADSSLLVFLLHTRLPPTPPHLSWFSFQPFHFLRVYPTSLKYVCANHCRIFHTLITFWHRIYSWIPNWRIYWLSNIYSYWLDEPARIYPCIYIGPPRFYLYRLSPISPGKQDLVSIRRNGLGLGLKLFTSSFVKEPTGFYPSRLLWKGMNLQHSKIFDLRKDRAPGILSLNISNFLTTIYVDSWSNPCKLG